MAERKYGVHINLDGNRIINGGFESLAVAPADATEGRTYFNTTLGRVLYYDGSAWVDPASTAASLTHISSTTPGVTVDDTDKTNVTVVIGSATTTVQGLMSNTDKALLDTATPAPDNDSIVKRSATGTIQATAPVDGNDLTNKTYVDALVSSGMTIKGAKDCSADPDYPAGIVGDTWHVSADGKIGGVAGDTVKIGDVIICVNDNAGGDDATVGADWIIVERNNDVGTTTIVGNVRFATPAEITAGTSTTTAVTPADVTTMLGSVGTPYKETLTSGSTSYVVNHGLNGAVDVTVRESATGKKVVTSVVETDANNVTITVNTAMAVDHVVSCIFAG